MLERFCNSADCSLWLEERFKILRFAPLRIEFLDYLVPLCRVLLSHYIYSLLHVFLQLGRTVATRGLQNFGQDLCNRQILWWRFLFVYLNFTMKKDGSSLFSYNIAILYLVCFEIYIVILIGYVDTLTWMIQCMIVDKIFYLQTVGQQIII